MNSIFINDISYLLIILLSVQGVQKRASLPLDSCPQAGGARAKATTNLDFYSFRENLDECHQFLS